MFAVKIQINSISFLGRDKFGVMTVNEQLQHIVSGFLKKHPNVSLNGLAKRTGVGATTLRRILNNSTKGEPAPHTILNIVSSIYKEKSIPALLQRIDGPVYLKLNESFDKYIYSSDTSYSYSIDLNEVLADRYSYLIYKLAANRTGTLRSTVLQEFGKLGEERLNDLIKMGYLIEDKSGEIHAKEKNFSLDVKLAKKHVTELIHFFKLEQINEGQNLLYTLSESINKEGIKAIKTIEKDAIKKILDVMQSKNYVGDIPYFTVHLSDTLTLEKRGELQ